MITDFGIALRGLLFTIAAIWIVAHLLLAKSTRDSSMPWTSDDAEKHTHKATTNALKALWAKVANDALERTGDEGRAVREANAVVSRQVEAR